MSIVLTDNHGYVIKLSSVLSGAVKSSKETTQEDATKKTGHMLTKILRKMKDESVINCDFYEHVRSSCLFISNLNRLQKVHEKNVPIHPVLNTNNSLYHLITKWLSKTLKSVRYPINGYNSLNSLLIQLEIPV